MTIKSWIIFKVVPALIILGMLTLGILSLMEGCNSGTTILLNILNSSTMGEWGIIFIGGILMSVHLIATTIFYHPRISLVVLFALIYIRVTGIKEIKDSKE